MKRFNHYMVVLHDRQKRSINKTVRTCRSASGAMRVANYLEKIKVFHSTYRATTAYQLDADNQPIWN